MKKIIIAMLMIVLISLMSLSVFGDYCWQKADQKERICKKTVDGNSVLFKTDDGGWKAYNYRVWVAPAKGEQGQWFNPRVSTNKWGDERDPPKEIGAPPPTKPAEAGPTKPAPTTTPKTKAPPKYDTGK